MQDNYWWYDLKIAVNTRLLLKDKLEGIGWVAYETLRRMVVQHPQDEFYFIFDHKPDPMFLFADNVKPVALFPPARHQFLFVAHFEFALPLALRCIKPDLFFSPDGYLSLRTKVPSVAQFHDLNFEHFPNDMPKLALWHYKRYFPRYARKANRIVTVSDFSKRDIVECYHVDPNKIDVAYNGANALFVPIAEERKAEVSSTLYWDKSSNNLTMPPPYRRHTEITRRDIDNEKVNHIMLGSCFCNNSPCTEVRTPRYGVCA